MRCAGGRAASRWATCATQRSVSRRRPGTWATWPLAPASTRAHGNIAHRPLAHRPLAHRPVLDHRACA
eukprot:2598813-Pleurochrysis_carterae.AAC.2